jgi:DNA-binding CsgD family transcriptional regulator
LAQLERELDNFRIAFSWSMAVGESARAQGIASILQTVWLRKGRFLEGSRWLDESIEHDVEHDPRARAWALTTTSLLAGYLTSTAYTQQAEEAVVLARQLDDPALLAQAIHAAGNAYLVVDPWRAQAYYQEGFELVSAMGDDRALPQMLNGLAGTHFFTGYAAEARAHLLQSLEILTRIGEGDSYLARQERELLADEAAAVGDLDLALSETAELLALPDLDSAHRTYVLYTRGAALAHLGDYDGGEAACMEALQTARDRGLPIAEANANLALGTIAMARGDLETARARSRALLEVVPQGSPQLHAYALLPLAAIELAIGDVASARRIVADLGQRLGEVGPNLGGKQREVEALIAAADGDPVKAEQLASDALQLYARIPNKLGICDTLELLAGLLVADDRAEIGTRLLAAANALRERISYARGVIRRGSYEEAVARARTLLSDDEFETTWREGASLSMEDAVAYATRGRGERKRATTGWASLTPSELDVARLVAEGLANKDIAERLFISPRTVQAHLTHIYAKLGITSRVQLAQAAMAAPR